MTDMFEPTLQDMIVCADREVEYRKRVYARLVVNGKMTQRQADWELACMNSIRDNLVMQAIRTI